MTATRYSQTTDLTFVTLLDELVYSSQRPSLRFLKSLGSFVNTVSCFGPYRFTFPYPISKVRENNVNLGGLSQSFTWTIKFQIDLGPLRNQSFWPVFLEDSCLTEYSKGNGRRRSGWLLWSPVGKLTTKTVKKGVYLGSSRPHVSLVYRTLPSTNLQKFGVLSSFFFFF